MGCRGKPPSTLQLCVPCCAVCALQRALAPVPPKRAKLEPFLAAAEDMNGTLVTQVNIALDRQPLRVLVGEDSATSGLWLSHHALGSRLIQETIVDAA